MYLFHSTKAEREQMSLFYEAALPLQTYAHITYPEPVCTEQADEFIDSWIRQIQYDHRCSVGSIISYERTKSIPLHHHVALVAPRPLSVPKVIDAGLGLIGHQHKSSVLADVYRRGEGGLSYIFKAENEDQCFVRESANLTWFAENPKRGQNASERRSINRIAEQIAEYRKEISNEQRTA